MDGHGEALYPANQVFTSAGRGPSKAFGRLDLTYNEEQDVNFLGSCEILLAVIQGAILLSPSLTSTATQVTSCFSN